MSGVRLNLGCGNDIREGWENYDKYPKHKDVQFLDLESFPLPFDDGYADEILLVSVFEHLSCNQYEFMKEMSRILKKDGCITVSVPSNRHLVEHEHGLFTCDYFNNLCTELYGNLFASVNYDVTSNTFRKKIWKVKQLLFWLFKDKISCELKK